MSKLMSLLAQVTKFRDSSELLSGDVPPPPSAQVKAAVASGSCAKKKTTQAKIRIVYYPGTSC